MIKIELNAKIEAEKENNRTITNVEKLYFE